MTLTTVRFRAASTAILRFVFGVVLSCGVALAEIHVNQPDSGKGSSDGELVATTGIDSRLMPTQYAFVTEESAWKRLWMSHIGRLSGDPIPDMPQVEFSDSIVIVIVEKPDFATSEIRVSALDADHDRVQIDYQQVPRAGAKRRSHPQNVYGFFVIPHRGKPIVVRRETNADDDDDGRQRRKRLDVVARYSPTENQGTEIRDSGSHAAATQMLNIGFAHDPGAGHYDGVVGAPGDVWNFVSVGTTAKDYMRNSDTTSSTARLRISRHDGAWGIAGQSGIFHGYIYDNCRCKDLEATILDLQSGRFRAYVYAHGDAPNQNARVELQVAGESLGEKATVKDGAPPYNSRPMAEGAQYVTFEFEINTGDEVKIISHRDGSSYSMFNAIQIVPLGQLQHAGTTASSVERGVR